GLGSVPSPPISTLFGSASSECSTQVTPRERPLLPLQLDAMNDKPATGRGFFLIVERLSNTIHYRKFFGRTVVITGASRGIGKEIALKLAQDGANIVIAAKTATAHPKLPGTIYTAGGRN
ncbi:hypothetical protein COOONC_15823, partial [Cooperia oncophora]